jgi:bifunctional non-homologous end joining protein LigD
MRKKQHVEVDGRELAISNVDKLYFPASGFTKGEVIAFYSQIADAILPHLRDRPLTLKRYPDGITGEHFYEKNAPSHTPDWVKRFAVPRTEREGEINYVLCNDRATLIWATNLGDIEKHVLLARAPDLHRPDAIVFDLDPGEPAGLLDCGKVALHLKELFEAWGLQIFVKVSGSKGLHLTVPLNSDATYEMTQPLAKAVAELVRQQMPKSVVSEMAKQLRKGKVLIDWSQNSDFKTTVGVYSMRAKREEPFVSMPIAWDELAAAVKRRKEDRLFFTPAAALKRIQKLGDLFEPVLTLRQELPAAFTEALPENPRPLRGNTFTNRSDRSLRAYTAKRDLTRTPEPAARVSSKAGGEKGARRFVIQKHQASHLHYDWRLEMEGVLRSWAVPKGPPTTLREARLAMHVEDHPMEYATFEGTIPPGNYGAGTVMVWDQGEYEDLTGNPTKAYYAGKLHLIMRGTKLNGEWILVKDRRKEDEKEKWLLIKAGESMPPFPLRVDDRSAVTGRSMQQITEANDAQWQSNRPAAEPKRATRRSTGRRAAPAFVEPMRCKPVTSLPQGEEWTFEIKFDGYRCIALKQGGEVSLYSRNRKLLNDRFPGIAEALTEVPGDFAIDGEVVALDEAGRPSFQLLQNSRSSAFDLLHLGDESLLAAPIERRREMLSALLPDPADPLRLSPILTAPQGQILEAVRTLGLEGVVGKRAGSLYEAGERTGVWIKHRVDRAQEFVIGGYIPGAHGFDSLLVGLHEGGRLVFVAKVKNGFVARTRTEIFAELNTRQIARCPFANLPEKKGARRGDALTKEKMGACRWVKPELVCEVAFVEWTDAGHLRHCTFVAMRDDKDASEIARET